LGHCSGGSTTQHAGTCPFALRGMLWRHVPFTPCLPLEPGGRAASACAPMPEPGHAHTSAPPRNSLARPRDVLGTWASCPCLLPGCAAGDNRAGMVYPVVPGASSSTACPAYCLAPRLSDMPAILPHSMLERAPTPRLCIPHVQPRCQLARLVARARSHAGTPHWRTPACPAV